MPEEATQQQEQTLEEPQEETQESEASEAAPADEAEGESETAAAKPQGDLNKALRAERQRVKELQDKLRAGEASLNVYNKISPYLSNPKVIQAIKDVAAGRATVQQAQAASGEDPEVEGFVQELQDANNAGPEGLKRFAKSLLTRVNKAAEVAARRAAEPAVRTSTASRAQTMLERAYQVRDDEGRPYARRDYIDAIASQVPEEVLANAVVMKGILDMARGQGGPGQAPSSPYGAPLYTEGPGARPMGRKEPLTPLDRSIMTDLGKNEKEYRALLDGIEMTDSGAVLE